MEMNHTAGLIAIVCALGAGFKWVIDRLVGAKDVVIEAKGELLKAKDERLAAKDEEIKRLKERIADMRSAEVSPTDALAHIEVMKQTNAAVLQQKEAETKKLQESILDADAAAKKAINKLIADNDALVATLNQAMATLDGLKSDYREIKAKHDQLSQEKKDKDFALQGLLGPWRTETSLLMNASTVAPYWATFAAQNPGLISNDIVESAQQALQQKLSDPAHIALQQKIADFYQSPKNGK
jgi:DNA repair exonuclease SbcCD ATPase subunit